MIDDMEIVFVVDGVEVKVLEDEMEIVLPDAS